MNKLFGIIGALLFVGAVIVGNFCSFPAASIVEVALGAFGLTSLIIGAVKNAETKNVALWKTISVIVLAIAGGVLCCIGGVSDSIFAEISGVVVALLAIILGIYEKKVADK